MIPKEINMADSKIFYHNKAKSINSMSLYKALSLFFLLSATLPVFGQKNIELKSPDGAITFLFKLPEKAPV
jgi:hypothetical protein